MSYFLNILTSTLASSSRFWRGTQASTTIVQPDQMIILFDQEGCPECRLVREVLTELNLNVMVAPCPVGGENIAKFETAFANAKLPLLVDLNSNSLHKGAEDCIHYLYQQYKGVQPESGFVGTLKNRITTKLVSLPTSDFATGIRFRAGIQARSSHQPDLPLILYSFESSPYSRPVRELLCELELSYILVNLGKQQFSDMGPASFHWTLKPYKPLPNTKREAFFKRHGNVQVPFLADPNTETEIFESEDILHYLQQTYGVQGSDQM